MTTDLQVAIALSVLSALSYAAAAVVQVHLASTGHRSTTRWLSMLTLTGAGAVLHVIALRFGTVSVVQALGALTLLIALPIAAARSRTRVEAAAWRDAGLTVVGLAGLLALTAAPQGSTTLTDTDGKCLAMITVVGVALLASAARPMPSPVLRSVLFAAASGVAFGVASVFVKTVAVGLSANGLTVATVPALATIGLLAVGGLLLGQLSYRGAGLAAPLATVSVVNPMVAAAVGILLLGEGFRFGSTGAWLALLAGALVARGVVGLAVRTAVTKGTTPAYVPQHAALAHGLHEAGAVH